MQFGTYANKGESSSPRLGIDLVTSLTINLSTINANKAIFFIRAGHLDTNVESFPLIDYELTNNKLVLYVNTNSYSTTKYFKWQVVEFY